MRFEQSNRRRPIPLEQVHAVIGVLCQANPVGKGTDAHLGEEQTYHPVEHASGIADAECLLDHGIGQQLVNVLQQL